MATKHCESLVIQDIDAAIQRFISVCKNKIQVLTYFLFSALSPLAKLPVENSVISLHPVKNRCF